MLTISKPLSAAQVCSYHAEAFTNAHENYYTTGDRIHGQRSFQEIRNLRTHGFILPRKNGVNPKNETLGKGTLCRERNCKWQRNERREWGGTQKPIRPAAEQRSRTRVSWRAASAVVILDGCESGGHYVAISVGSCQRLGIAVCCVTSRLRSRPSSLL